MAIVRYKPDPLHPPRLTPEQKARLEAMTEEEIERNAREDPDNPPMTEEELERAKAALFIRRLREKSGLSQSRFAAKYHINPARLRDWEQGRFAPDSVAMAYLKVIAVAPEAVEKALGAS